MYQDKSLPQDSAFDACYKCYNSVSDKEAIKCMTCQASYHRNCAEVAEGVDQWHCLRCSEKKVPSQASSHGSKKSKSRSSNSSRSSSSRFDMHMKIIAEKQKLMERQQQEIELRMKEKHRQENELIEMKLSLLKESDEPVLLDVGEEEKPKEKVTGWLSSEQHRQDESVGKPPLSSTTIPVKSQLNGASQEQNAEEPPLSSTSNPLQSPNLHQTGASQSTNFPKKATFSDNVPTNPGPESFEHSRQTNSKATQKQEETKSPLLDYSVIAARHVIGKKLPPFHGDPLSWPIFLSQFETSTKVCHITDAENLLRLAEALKGDAHKAVEKLLYMPENVPSIIDILRRTFGRPEFIVNSILESIRSEPKPKYEVFDSIIAFSLQVNNLYSTIKNCGMSNDLGLSLMIELVEKLPTPMKFDWAIYKSSMAYVNLEVFNRWLESKATSLTAVLSRPPQLSKYTKPTKGYVNLHANIEGRSCVICLKECAEVPACPTFTTASYSEKWRLVKTHNICRICLKKHQGRCHSAKKCEVNDCPYKHNTLLHKPAENDDTPIESLIESTNIHNDVSTKTLFKVIPVNLFGKNRTISTYAFLDEGSSVTLLDHSIATELQLTGSVHPLCIRWTNNHTVTDIESRKVSVSIGSISDRYKRFALNNVRTIQNLKLPMQSLDVEELKSSYPHLRNVPINSYFNVEPGILIGLDNVRLCSSNKYRTGKLNEPVAAKTALGWSIYGMTSKSSGKSEINLHICECEQLSNAVKNFISFDNINVKDDYPFTKNDQKAIKEMEKSIRFNDGNYECGLLWRFNEVDLPESFEMAKRRSNCLLKRLHKDPGLHKVLDDKIQDYINKSYARKLSISEISESQHHWYLPVFPVVNPNKPGKVRLVWDAAAKSHNVSLNDYLYKGPDLLNSLPGILLRFRENKFGLAGDIMEMFHQIRLKPSEQKYHWFLWQRLDEDKPSVYAMTVMSFGAACSPCISQFVKNHHAAKYSKVYPRAVEAIHKNHYVDDWLDSFKTEEEALSISSEVHNILSSGGFTMKNWVSNSQIVSSNVGGLSSREKVFSEKDMQTEKVLGMWWETSTDSFLFSLKLNKGNHEVLNGKRLPTKRELLRILM